MSRPVALRVLTLAALAVSTACAGDAATAPVGPAIDGAAFARGTHGKQVDVSLTETITVDPTRSRTYHFGQNWVYIPANVVCTLETPYGPSEWDRPCDRATAPIQLTVTVGTDVEGYPTASFSPDLRFAPAATPYRWVFLGLKVQRPLDLEGYGILYQPTGSDILIDESATDPTLRAWRARGNVVARRIKHFSGYNVSLGFTEQTAPIAGALFGGAW